MNVRKPQSKGLLTKGQLEILKAFRKLPDVSRLAFNVGGVTAGSLHYREARDLEYHGGAD